MSLISQIINELADPSIGLSAPLLKTQIFATRTDNPVLKNWAINELGGYQRGDDVPSYRLYQSHLSKDYQMGAYAPVMVNQPVEPLFLPLEEAKRLIVAEFTESVTSLEKVRDKDLNEIGFVVSSAQRHAYQNAIRKSGGVNSEITVLDIRKTLPGTIPAQILDSVRQKLLEFMLAIEAKYGEVTDIAQLRQHSQAITLIMNTTINNSGHGAAINTGNGATMTTSSVVNVGSQSELANRLREKRISELDIEDLLTVVDQHPIDLTTGRFSPPVNSWITKMIGKALDGSWEIAVGAAGGVLAELLNAYYGVGK